MSFNEAKKILLHLTKFRKEIEAMRTIMGVEAVNHYKKSFKDGGFTDNSLEKWKKRSKRENRRGKTTDSGVASVRARRAILVKIGTLKRSINYVRSGKYTVVINTGALPYAKIHNDGGTINKKSREAILNFNKKGAFQRQRTERQRANTSYSQKVSIGTHSIKIPKRQFIGYSQTLNNKILSRIDSKIKRIFA